MDQERVASRNRSDCQVSDLITSSLGRILVGWTSCPDARWIFSLGNRWAANSAFCSRTSALWTACALRMEFFVEAGGSRFPSSDFSNPRSRRCLRSRRLRFDSGVSAGTTLVRFFISPGLILREHLLVWGAWVQPWLSLAEKGQGASDKMATGGIASERDSPRSCARGLTADLFSKSMGIIGAQVCRHKLSVGVDVGCHRAGTGVGRGDAGLGGSHSAPAKKPLNTPAAPAHPPWRAQCWPASTPGSSRR